MVASADLIPPPKTLSQRISQPKPQPKSAATDKATGNAAKAAPGAKVAARKPRRGRNSRPAKKTAAVKIVHSVGGSFGARTTDRPE